MACNCCRQPVTAGLSVGDRALVASQSRWSPSRRQIHSPDRTTESAHERPRAAPLSFRRGPPVPDRIFANRQRGRFADNLGPSTGSPPLGSGAWVSDRRAGLACNSAVVPRRASRVRSWSIPNSSKPGRTRSWSRSRSCSRLCSRSRVWPATRTRRATRSTSTTRSSPSWTTPASATVSSRSCARSRPANRRRAAARPSPKLCSTSRSRSTPKERASVGARRPTSGCAWPSTWPRRQP